jgi:hypothetical protein
MRSHFIHRHRQDPMAVDRSDGRTLAWDSVMLRGSSTGGGRELEMRVVPVHRLSGVVLNARGEVAPHIELFARKSGHEQLTAVSADDGTFEFPALLDGEWRILVRSVDSDTGRPGYRAELAQRIDGRDSKGVKVRLDAQ